MFNKNIIFIYLKTLDFSVNTVYDSEPDERGIYRSVFGGYQVDRQLTEQELAVLKRGRNATGNTVPKHADAVEYRRATAIECLLGYLYLTGRNGRIRELFEIIINSDLNENEQIGV